VATPPEPKPSRPASLEPVPRLLSRIGAELSADFVRGRPTRISRAPGRLDVMGGIADYTGSAVCEAPLDRAAAIASQERDDRFVQVVSLNLLDEHLPFTLRISLDDLAEKSIAQLRAGFAEPGKKWAGYLVGCLAVLHERKLVDLKNPAHRGVSLALYSDVPLGAGVSSSAAVEVAAMMNFLDHFGVRGQIDPMQLASLCQRVENHVVGAPCGIMDQVTSCYGHAGSFLVMLCQPHELQPPLLLPEGIRAVGINSQVKHSVGGSAYARTRCAAFMGHAIILAKMREMGLASKKELLTDPMGGYLANLDIDSYKKFFRPYLPESLRGREFLDAFGPTLDTATQVDPAADYHVLGATDHHVLEAHRVRNFVAFLREAATQPAGSREKYAPIDKAGHLMYASHLSYTNDARMGADECDLLVDLVRQHEPAGLYGAKITGGGSGGTVAVLADISPRADDAIVDILSKYADRTGHKAEAFLGTSPGAWHTGTELINF
jgi:galactokinase